MKYSCKKIFTTVTLALCSVVQLMVQVQAAGLSTPSDAYVLVQDTQGSSAYDTVSYRLFRQPVGSGPHQVWSTGELATTEFIDIFSQKKVESVWPGSDFTHSKSIILKSSVVGSQPIALLGYSPHTLGDHGGKMVVLRGESQPPGAPSMSYVHTLQSYATMSRLSNDHALVVSPIGRVGIIDAQGKVHSPYGNTPSSIISTKSLVDAEVMTVHTKSSQSYVGATFHMALLEHNAVSLGYIDTSNGSGGNYHKIFFVPNFKPYKILAKDDYVFVFSQDSALRDATVVSIFQVKGKLGSSAELHSVAEYYLTDASDDIIKDIQIRNTTRCLRGSASEILGLESSQSAQAEPLLRVHQRSVEYTYELPPAALRGNARNQRLPTPSAPIVGARSAIVLSYDLSKYAKKSLGTYAPLTIGKISVAIDTDPVPGAIVVVGAAPAVAPQQSLDKESQRFGVNLLEAVRTQRPSGGAAFRATGDAQADTQTLLALFREDLQIAAPKQAAAFEGKPLEQLTFSMQEFVALVNSTPRFKFLLQSHLSFRQREALGFFWDFNGIRSHNFIPTESERVALSQVIAELLRGDANNSTSTARCSDALVPEKI